MVDAARAALAIDMADPVALSPLAHRTPIRSTEGGISLAEWPFLGKLLLRCDPTLCGEAVAQAIGIALPQDAGRSAMDHDRAWLWLGPDAWLLVAPDRQLVPLHAELSAALAASSHQTVDLSDQMTVITLSGSSARDVLSRLVTIDLHPRALPAGSVAGTRAGQSDVILWLRDDSAAAGPVFDLFVPWSLADYLWCLIADAGRGFGLPAQPPLGGERLRLFADQDGA